MATMTANEMIPAVNQQVLVRMERLTIAAIVKDVRYVYGKPQLLITPVNGAGQQWVELSRICLQPSTDLVNR